MLKRDELTNPNSCLNRARDDEMVFTLLGRDAAAPAAIRYWIERRIRLGKNQRDDAQICEAELCAQTMEAHQAGPRLTAAAPDLLQACRAMVDALAIHGFPGGTNEVLSADRLARAAIAKATGEGV